MITWLQTLDAALFRVLNQSHANPVFDWLMPKLGSHQLFVAGLLAVAAVPHCNGGGAEDVSSACFSRHSISIGCASAAS